MEVWHEIFRQQGQVVQSWFLGGREWYLTDLDREFLRSCSICLQGKLSIVLDRENAHGQRGGKNEKRN